MKLTIMLAMMLAAIAGVAQTGSWTPPRITIHEGGSWREITTTPTATTALASPDEGHVFSGTARVTNGLTTLVAGDHGVAIYSVAADGQESFRVQLALLNEDGRASAGCTRVELLAASRSAVEVAVAFSGPGGDMSATLTLKRGAATWAVEAPDVHALRVAFAARFMVVPAFVGEDLLIDPAEYRPGLHFLPADNLLLGFIAEDAMIQVVWPTGGEQAVEMEVAHAPSPMATAVQATFTGQPLHVAVWARPGLWHGKKVDATFGERPKAQNLKLSWRTPFFAKWRAIFHSPKTDTTWFLSWRKHNKEWGPHGRKVFYPWPFWANGAGGLVPKNAETFVHLPPDFVQPEVPETLLVYALERERRTPVEIFLPEDILVQALGAGPCQYLLDLDGQSPTRANRHPLCALAAQMGNLLLVSEPLPRDSEMIPVYTDFFLEQGLWQYERMKSYVAFAQEVLKLCTEAEEKTPEAAAALAPIVEQAREILGHDQTMEQTYRERRDNFGFGFKPAASSPPDAMRELADEMKRIVKERHPESLAEWRNVIRKLHHLAVTPQGLLPHPRRLARKMQYEVTRIARDHPEVADVSSQIRAMAGKTLRNQHWSEQGTE